MRDGAMDYDIAVACVDFDALAIAKPGGFNDLPGRRMARFLPHLPTMTRDMTFTLQGIFLTYPS